MLRQRHQYRLLIAAFLFALVGVAFFAGGMGARLQYPQEDSANTPAKGEEHWYREEKPGWKDPLVVVTAVLVIVTGAMAGAIFKQVRLARSEFIATHRPKLRVFAFQLGDWDTPHDVPISVLFQAQNVGESDAHVFRVEGNIFIAPRNNMPLEPALHMPFNEPYSVDLTSGERDQFGITDGPAATEMNATGIYAGQTPIVCVGRISYRDKSGIERQTGFARKFAIRPHRSSERITDPDYEYEY